MTTSSNFKALNLDYNITLYNCPGNVETSNSTTNIICLTSKVKFSNVLTWHQPSVNQIAIFHQVNSWTFVLAPSWYNAHFHSICLHCILQRGQLSTKTYMSSIIDLSKSNIQLLDAISAQQRTQNYDECEDHKKVHITNGERVRRYR